MKKLKRFKRGATSFYVVAFSTLILVIIAASFATVMISEVTRTSNDDLSQSAYDAALAGVEDAKLAYTNYQRCVAAHPDMLATSRPTSENVGVVDCNNIVYWMDNDDCDMVAKMLGRETDGDAGVFITETRDRTGMSMNQYYTCVKIDTVLDDYRANLTMDNNVRVVKVQFADGVRARDIKRIRLSWYLLNATETTNFANTNGSRVTFTPVNEARPATPPTISFQMVQTTESFSLGGFSKRSTESDWTDGFGVNGITDGSGTGATTDRATLFLVPTDSTGFAQGEVDGNYKGVYNGSKNLISKDLVAKTNDQAISHLPYVTYCGDTDVDFACAADIILPNPVSNGNNSGSRNDDTFMFLVTLPYGEPDTDFSMMFFTDENDDDSRVDLVNTQITIDSTGRANNLYRRVETRLESSDTSFPYPYYAMELFDDGATIQKDMTVRCENNFYDPSTNVVYDGSGLPGSTWTDPLSGTHGCS